MSDVKPLGIIVYKPVFNAVKYVPLKVIIPDNDKYVSLSTTAKTQIFHYRCFMSFLYAEKNKKYINTETNKIECRCPLRTPFNFKKCYEKVSYD